MDQWNREHDEEDQYDFCPLSEILELKIEKRVITDAKTNTINMLVISSCRFIDLLSMNCKT